ncbi:uncharacterized protein SAPINGB_P005890 [Magnusiomyces paraingens]|uniref:Uncharacterized protein n=1 Tax=Magnusiomyces paraingens TaxID=2606893 RepID=A0A5E8C1Q9_9ASCO|nr:uncharacterized protein SAPINGB_P005890 [Saprochaete ingens]VVT57829.1 unnamed protein product [Saprochaete ingens]
MKELLNEDYEYLKLWAKQDENEELITDFSKRLSGEQWHHHCAYKAKNAFTAFKKKRRGIIALTTIHLGNIFLTAFSAGAYGPIAAVASAVAQAGGDAAASAVIEALLEGLIEAGIESGEITIELLATLTNEYYDNYKKVIEKLDEKEHYSYDEVKGILPYPGRL